MNWGLLMGSMNPYSKPYLYTAAQKYKLTCTTVPSKVVGIHKYPV